MTGSVDLAAAMMRVHDELRASFHRHQVALLDRDVELARGELARFRDALERHIDDEERLVLPVYAERGGEHTDSPPAQFEAEHRKLRTLLARLVDRLAALQLPPDDAALLELLDAETAFKSLFAHHDMREERVLYPRLTEWTTAAEREAIAARIDSG